MGKYTDEDYEKLLDENLQLQNEVRGLSNKLHKYMEMLFDYSSYMDKFVEIKIFPTVVTFLLSCILSIVYCHYNFHTSNVGDSVLIGVLIWFVTGFIINLYSVMYYNFSVDRITDENL
jgi:uncharacterized membrane protein YagU involved in acid resistance